MTGGAGLRERKKAETRQALASAALRLADERGPDAVTVEDIAALVGVSPRTFFNYYPTKEDAIVGIPEGQSSEVVDELMSRPADEAPLEALRQSMLAASERLEARADEWAMRHRVVQRYPTLAARYAVRFAAFEHGIIKEIARRLGVNPSRDTYPALVTAAALSATRVAITAWQERTRRVRLVTLLDDAFAALENGLAIPDRLR
jgi:AcrR family transcriptional regulator